MKIQEVIQKIKQKSTLLLLEDQNVNALSVCLDIYNEIKDLSTEEFVSLLEAIEGNIEEKARDNEVSLRNLLIQTCLFFDPELNKDKKDLDKRVSYLSRLMNKDINVNNALHIYTRAPLELAIMSNSIQIVEFLIKEKNAHLQGEKIKYVIGLLNYNLDTMKDEDGRDDIIKILYNVRKVVINDANSEGCKSILEFMSDSGIKFKSGVNREEQNIKEVLSSLSKTNMEILKEGIEKKDEAVEDQAYKLLVLAVESGLVGLPKKLLNLGLDPNKQMEYTSTTLLLQVAKSNDLEMVKELLARGADPNISDGEGKVPLHEAVHYGNLEIVKLLLARGADINVQDKYRNAPLHEAARYGRLEIVKLLLVRGANINIQDNLGRTPLNIATRYLDHLDIAQELLEKGANYKIQDEEGRRLLYYAAKWNYVILLKELLAGEANINIQNKTGQTPLHYAANYGSLEVVKLLIEKGANINIQDDRGWTPLYEAVADYKHLEIVKLLIEEGANINIQDSLGRTPLHWAAQRNNLEVTKELLALGADPNIRDKSGQTPLHHGSLEVVKLLLAGGANINIQDNLGRTPLHLAAQQNNLEVTKELLAQQGADPNTPDKSGQTPLHYGRLEIVKLLLAGGANINIQDNMCWTPLHSAILKDNPEIVKELIAKGANINIKDCNGQTPLELAKDRARNSEIIQLLEERAQLESRIPTKSDIPNRFVANESKQRKL